uniref:F-box protein 34 n=1 Tax=Neolamprologus brichardi TaxID=32507 RepID=A0A3Q4GH94_NEOBR
MHLKSYPKLVRSELRLDASGVQTGTQRSSLFVSQQGGLLRTYTGNHGSSSRFPFSVISTNTLRCPANAITSSVTSLCLKTQSGTTLQHLPLLPPGCENNAPKLFQTAAEDADTPLDVWTVIKPGHVREKIAIFVSERGREDSAGGGESVKAKGSWDENCTAKRRRRSGNTQNLQQDQRAGDLRPAPQRPHSGQQCGGELGTAEEADPKVSVVDMVAFLEQRASEQQLDSKPVLALQRSCTTIMLSRAPPTKLRDGSEHRGEEPESVRVSDMVARLESECLRRRAEGDLSRSNSLRRTAGRVLLAAATGHSSTPSQPASPSSPAAQCLSREPVGCLPASALTTPLSGELVKSEEAAGVERERTVTETHLKAPPSEEEEPVPGLLFLSPTPEKDSTPSAHRPPCHRATYVLQPFKPAPCSTDSQSEKTRRRGTEDAGVVSNPASAPLVWRASASQDFLEKRQRLQQLLEPQPYLTALPHHLLVKILLLLPTQSLAALKCACSYFKFIIENYGVRPADSLWVSDPRYRDDPCKQCKKRYGRGDVSLCRWHHKPYCQALPYGPGYWMCCHGARRDTPGCNVGLHDNRWVPAFHSINQQLNFQNKGTQRYLIAASK